MTQPDTQRVTLTSLAEGERARVLDVDAVDPVGLRVLEMGLTPGIEVARIGTAPLGDPIEFEVRGYRLSLRRVEADRVRIARLG